MVIGVALRGLGKALTKTGRSLSNKGRSIKKSKLSASAKYGSRKYKTRSTLYHKTTPIEKKPGEASYEYMRRLSKYNWAQKRKREKIKKAAIAGGAAGAGVAVGYATGKRKKKD